MRFDSPCSTQSGKILFLNGAPGAGKSTAAYELAKNHGYIFYEGDCFMKMINPYIRMDIELDTCDSPMQKPLKNYPIETVKAVNSNIVAWSKKHMPDEIDLAFFEEMAKNVKHDWQRIGYVAMSSCIYTMPKTDQKVI